MTICGSYVSNAWTAWKDIVGQGRTMKLRGVTWKCVCHYKWLWIEKKSGIFVANVFVIWCVRTYWLPPRTDRIEYKLSWRLGTFSRRMMIVWCVLWAFRLEIAARRCGCVAIVFVFHILTIDATGHTVARCGRCCVRDFRAARRVFSAAKFEFSRIVRRTAGACIRKFSRWIRSFRARTWFCIV